ncbi:hypothetical protein F5B17DRAFT_361141 [Nemania serpens]|nr:hypothetical protein F5B17DRAFT_361141 [Nemania serpens]
MSTQQTTLIGRQLSPSDGVRTLTIPRAESTVIETLTLGNGVAYSTAAVAPASKSSSPSSSYVGAILSGVVAVVLFLLVVWVCCRRGRTRSRRSRGSSRQSRPENSSSNGNSDDSGSTSGSSSPEGGAGSGPSEMVEDLWVQQTGQPMPGMTPPVAGQWTVPPPPPGISQLGVGVGNMAMPFGRGGPPPLMGRGGGPPHIHRGPPPIPPIVSGGGPSPMPQ